jgi:hypothetical protein
LLSILNQLKSERGRAFPLFCDPASGVDSSQATS